MGLLPGELGRRAGGICTLIFVAPLQVTPVASPDCNFAVLAATAEEQDAEVRGRWTLVPLPGQRDCRRWQRMPIGWGLFWKKPSKVVHLDLLEAGCRAEGLSD